MKRDLKLLMVILLAPIIIISCKNTDTKTIYYKESTECLIYGDSYTTTDITMMPSGIPMGDGLYLSSSEHRHCNIEKVDATWFTIDSNWNRIIVKQTSFERKLN